MIMKVGMAAAAVMLVTGCAGSDGAADAAPSTTTATATATRTATQTVTSEPKTSTTTATVTITVTQTETATAAPAPAAPAPQPTSTATTTAPAPNSTVGSDGVTYEVPTTDEGLEGWCSRLEIPEDVRAPHCLAG